MGRIKFLVFIVIIIQCIISGNSTVINQIDNCGANAIITIAIRLGFDIPEPNKEELNQAIEQNKVFDFIDIRTYLNKLGINSRSFHVDDIEEIFSILTPGRIAILHLSRGGDGHFVLISRQSNGSILFDDYPKIGIQISENDLKGNLHNKFSGNVIIVGNNAQNLLMWANVGSQNTVINNLRTDDAIAEQFGLRINRVVNLGEFNASADKVSGVIEIFNKSTEHRRIKEVKGSCACFKGADKFDPDIAPGELRIITINYNPHKMSKNDNNVVEGQLAVVVDGNADNPFNIKAEGRLIVAKWFLVPEGTDVGVVSLNSLAKVNINFSIFSPDKHIIKQISNGVRVEESPSGQLKEGGFLEIYRFTGHLNQTQIGPFESKISLFDESGNSRDFKISGVICK